jgi:predicted aspartyl protease
MAKSYVRRHALLPATPAAHVVMALLCLASPALAQSDASSAKAISIRVPFHLQAGHAYVDVEINGQGPFHFIFDTGAVNVMTPATAERLGLASKGNVKASGTGGTQRGGIAKVKTVSLGSLIQSDQVFYVIALPSTMGDGVQVDGLIGYEWLKKFPVKFDYDANALTIYTNPNSDLSMEGLAIPITFKGKTPQIEGAVDGFSGRFTLDTGSNGSLTLSTPFVDGNDLVNFYHAKTKIMSAIGVGGPVYSLMARSNKLTLGAATVDKPVTFLSQQTKGTSTDRAVAGNIGFGVLHRFNVVFDYPHSKIYLTPNTHWAEPDLADRSGLRIDAEKGLFTVVYVAENSPGSASGLQAGDRITAINGSASTTLSLADLRMLLKGNVGTKISFLLEREGKTAVLELRDL